MPNPSLLELPPSQFPKALPVYQDLHFCIPLQAVLEGNSPGRVFVDQIDMPSVAFTWTRWGYYYLAGAADHPGFYAALRQRLEEELIPASVAGGERWPLIYPSPQGWDARIEFLLGKRLYQKLFRRVFSFDQEQFHQLQARQAQPPAGYELKRVDAQLLVSNLGLANGIAATWNSVEAFLERGLGFCLVQEGSLVSSCLACFGGAGSLEINVETQEAYYRQGLATSVCTAFIDECLKRGLRPNWECWWTNEPSTALAARLGFESRFDLPVYWWEEKDEASSDKLQQI